MHWPTEGWQPIFFSFWLDYRCHGLPEFRDPQFSRITPYARLLFWLLLWNAVVGPFTQACGNQIRIQRLLSTKDWKAGFRSECISVALDYLLALPMLFIGFALVTYYQQHPDPMLEKLGGDAVFFRFVATKMPTPMPGVFMAAMLAAIMSTLDSGINSMATVWLKEFHQRYFNRNLTEAQQVRVSKWATLIVGIVSISLALGLCYSGKWLKQSVTEVRTLFGFLAIGTLPAACEMSRAALAGRTLELRRWRAGDRIAPTGLNGHSRKLQDVFMTAKVPPSVRADLPLICDAATGEVLWVPGYRIAQAVAVESATAPSWRFTLSTR